MSCEEEREFIFQCPECGERLEVNGPMRETLVERGCVICSATVTEAAFTR
jgi:rRNA maturation protein Nop10